MKETPMQEEFDMEKELAAGVYSGAGRIFQDFRGCDPYPHFADPAGGGAKCGGFGRRTGNEPIRCVASAARTAAE